MSSRRARRSRILIVLTGGLVALTLAGCTGDGAGSIGNESGSDAGGSVVEEDSAGEGAAAEDLGGTEQAADESAVDREIITTGHATVVAPDPAAAAQELARLVEQAGGRVEQRSEIAPTEESPGQASLTVRLPADRMTSTVDALSGIGEVRDVNLDSVDVTSQGRDLDARIAALTTSTERLRELMSTAGSTEDLLAVEQELSDRQADLDALTAQRQQLSDQVAMSTLDVDITSEPVTVAQSRGGFLGGLSSGWGGLVATVEGVVLVFGVLLPWLALAAVGYVGYRLVRRRLRPAPPATPGGPASGPGGDDLPDDAPVAPEPEPVGR
jgi:glycine cleavage system regulatory protein